MEPRFGYSSAPDRLKPRGHKGLLQVYSELATAYMTPGNPMQSRDSAMVYWHLGLEVLAPRHDMYAHLERADIRELLYGVCPVWAVAGCPALS